MNGYSALSRDTDICDFEDSVRFRAWMMCAEVGVLGVKDLAIVDLALFIFGGLLNYVMEAKLRYY